jgi:hypothetical protein
MRLGSDPRENDGGIISQSSRSQVLVVAEEMRNLFLINIVTFSTLPFLLSFPSPGRVFPTILSA